MTALGCVPISLRWTLVRNGVPTRLGRAALVSLAGVIVAILLLRYFTKTETGY